MTHWQQAFPGNLPNLPREPLLTLRQLHLPRFLPTPSSRLPPFYATADILDPFSRLPTPSSRPWYRILAYSRFLPTPSSQPWYPTMAYSRSLHLSQTWYASAEHPSVHPFWENVSPETEAAVLLEAKPFRRPESEVAVRTPLQAVVAVLGQMSLFAPRP
jgi:hypothetical protein